MNNLSCAVHGVFIPACYTGAMIPRLIAVLLASSALAVASAHAASHRLKVDHAASKVEFSSRATMHGFTGSIESWELDLRITDGAELPDVVVFTGNGASMTTAHGKRDAEMHHWMEHDKFPDVQFTLLRFSGTPEARVAEGELTLHGVSLSVAIPVTLERHGNSLTVSGGTVLDTTRFGLPQFRKFGVLTVAPEVKVSFHVTGDLE